MFTEYDILNEFVEAAGQYSPTYQVFYAFEYQKERLRESNRDKQRTWMKNPENRKKKAAYMRMHRARMKGSK